MTEPLLYELSVPGRAGVRFPEPDVPLTATCRKACCAPTCPCPELSELDVVRHFTRLSQLNYCIDTGFYPLGSCTMKYNPKINEDTARLPGFAAAHPFQPIETVQGSLLLMYELQEWLKEIGGFAGVTLQPAAGAHGELTGVLIIRAYHQSRGDTKRTKILIPDSAHGTNPATSAMSGLQVVAAAVRRARQRRPGRAASAHATTRWPGMMLTNPNTLGLFDENVLEVIAHRARGRRPGVRRRRQPERPAGHRPPGRPGHRRDALQPAQDLLHPARRRRPGLRPGRRGRAPGRLPARPARRHRRRRRRGDCPPLYGFITPGQVHRPGEGLPRPLRHAGARLHLHPHARRRRACAKIAEYAVLNANYLLARLHGRLPRCPTTASACTSSCWKGSWADAPDVHALDIAKRLMDYGFHPPTNYFPLIVHEALMIEPTETESKQTLDAFADAMLKIAEEAHTQPELLKSAPHNTPVGRLDEVKAAKELVLCCGVGAFKE